MIQNETLRNQLSSWPTHMQLIRDRTNANHSHSLEVSLFVSKYGNWLRVDSKFPLVNIQLPASGFEETNVPLLQMAEFENLLDVQVVFKDELLNRLISTRKVCEEILVLIQKELDP